MTTRRTPTTKRGDLNFDTFVVLDSTHVASTPGQIRETERPRFVPLGHDALHREPAHGRVLSWLASR
jgi:hypothetical protein